MSAIAAGQDPLNPFDRAILRWMQELSPYGVVVTDDRLRIQRWNQWLETNSGMKASDVVDRPLFEVFPELVERRMHRYFEAALKGEASVLSFALHGYVLPLPSPLPAAGFLHMLQTVRITPLVTEDKVIGTITTIEDVTQREYQNSRVNRQHQGQALFSWALTQLIETSDPESVLKSILPRIASHLFVDTYINYLAEPNGRYLRLHSAGGISREAYQKLSRIPIEQALCGRDLQGPEPVIIPSIHHSNDPKAAFARELSLRAYVCNPLVVGDKLIGSLAFASRTRDRFTQDELEFSRIVAQYVAVAIDRARNEDALRTAQRSLRTHAQSLEQKVQERTETLQETINELETFSYSLAHDVRAPLRHIRGYSDALLEDHSHELTPGARGYIDAIRRSIGHLEALTRDILEYSKVSSKPLELASVDLDTLVQDMVAHIRLNGPGIIDIRSPLQPVLAERGLLIQCLSNLLENALKFTAAHVEPRVVVRTELRDDSGRSSTPSPPIPSDKHNSTAGPWVRIWIEDNGIGISPEFHSKIFGIFERLSTNRQGTGIGLAIVAKAVQRMSGRFGVESEPGKGSRFWIELLSAS